MEFSDEDQLWLESRGGSHPQEVFQIAEQLHVLLTKGVMDLGLQLNCFDADNISRLHQRLWGCWKYHWQRAVNHGKADGLEVAQRVSLGQDVITNRSLGGFPFLDVILAESVVLGIPQAVEQFTGEYRGRCFHQVSRVMEIEHPSGDWWDYLMAKFRGTSSKPGKLAKYLGHCGLKPFLDVVVERLLLDLLREPKRAALPIEPRSLEQMATNRADPSLELISFDCRQRLSGLLQSVLEEMQPIECLILLFRLEQQLSNEEIAGILQVKVDSVNYRFFRAKTKLAQLIQKRLKSHSAEAQDCNRCLDELEQGGGLDGLLSDALRRVHERRQSS